MYLCREITGLNYDAIGRHFGGRANTTVIYGREKVARLLSENDPDTLRDLQDIRDGLRERGLKA